MPTIVETTVFQFYELSPDARDRARAWFREGAADWDWHDAVYEDFAHICGILGIALKTRPVRLMGGGARAAPCIYFSGFGSQGDGACFEGRYRYAAGAGRRIREHAPQDRTLHDIADQLQQVQRRNFFGLHADIVHRGRYCHAHSMQITVDREGGSAPGRGDDDHVADILRELSHWLFRQLEREWDYVISDAYANEGIAANEYTFTATGQRFG